MKKNIFIMLLLIFLASWSEAADKANFFGMTHGFKNVDASTFETDLREMKKAGVEAVRIPFHWDVIEKRQGTYAFERTDKMIAEAKKNSIKVQATINRIPEWASLSEAMLNFKNIDNYKEFVRKSVQRYKDYVKEWEIWNEPNNQPFWTGTAEEYAELLKVSYETIKKEDPDAIVIGIASGSLGFWSRPDRWEFVEKVLKAKGGNYLDAVSVHTHRGASGPDMRTSKGKWAVKWTQYEEIKELSALLSSFGLNKDIYITEVGWKDTIGEDHQAAFLLRLYISMYEIPAVKRVNWFYWREDTYAKDDYGLMHADMTPKQSYYAYKTAQELLRGATFKDRRFSDEAIIYHFTKNGKNMWIAWTPDNKKRNLGLSLISGKNKVQASEIMKNSESKLSGESVKLSKDPILLISTE